jgi:hypothetical protein
MLEALALEMKEGAVQECEDKVSARKKGRRAKMTY